MPSLKVNQFGGMLPAWDDTLLPEDQASFARDTYLYSGALTGWRKPKLLRALQNSAARFAFRLPTQAEAVATAYLIFIDNPNNGDNVTVGEQTYTFASPPTATFQVLRGATPTQSAENLFSAITLNGVSGQQFGLGTCVNSAITGNAPYAGLRYSTAGGTNTPGAGTLFLIPIIPNGTNKAVDVAVMPAATVPTAKFTGVLYDDANGKPGSLVAVGTEQLGCTNGVPLVSNFSAEHILQTGSTYWAGFLVDSAVSLTLGDAGTTGVLALSTYNSGAPASAPVMTVDKPDWQVWVDLQLIQSINPRNTLGTHDFGFGALPEITVQAPDFGAAYNVTTVGESTGGARLLWLFADTLLSHVTTTLQGGANQTEDDSILGASTWLEFVDPDTNVLRSPVVDDSFKRFYFASPSQPPKYNTHARIVNGDPAWLLGVPAPGCTPGLSVTQGGNTDTVGLPTSSTVNTADMIGANLWLIPVTPTGAMSIDDVSVVPQTNSASARFIGVIYSDNLGVPGELIAQGAEVLGCTAGTAIVSQFVIPPGLSVNTKYWIGFINDTSVALQKADDVFTTGVVAANAFLSGPPAAAPAMTINQADWQLWADVTTQAVLETRAYVYTWVTEYGEEGPPSPPTLATAWSNSTWTISLFTPAPDEMGVKRNITRTNLYRTVSGVGGETTFFHVASFDVKTLQYVDTISDDSVAQDYQLPSTNWHMPPTGLQGIVRLSSGAFAGWKANEVWFSEPYQPHAWPPGYVLTTDFPIVGLGATGQAVIACTTSRPSAFFGPTPASMSEKKVEIAEPCISRGSIVSTDSGVTYASRNGLILVTQYGDGSNATEHWITRERWQQLTPQKSVRAVKHVSSYFAFGSVDGTDHSVAQQGYTVEMSGKDAASFTIWPQAGGHRVGFAQAAAPGAQDVYNVMIDPWSGVCMLIQNGGVYYYDFSDSQPEITPYKWRSKQYQQVSKKNFEAMRIFFSVPPGSPAPPVSRTFAAELGDDIAYDPAMYGVVRVYADGVLVTARELRSSGELMRICSGFKAEFWQWEIEGRVAVSNLQTATSVRELAKV